TEALQAQADRIHGEITLARPLSSWALTVMAAAIAALLVAYLCMGSYTRRATAIGILAPSAGAAKVIAPAAGIVVERRVEEGDRVKRDDVLFIVADERHLAASGQRLSDELQNGIAKRRTALQ